MDLHTLYRRVEHELGAEAEDTPVRLLAPNGETYEIISLNYDHENEQYVLIGEEADE